MTVSLIFANNASSRLYAPIDAVTTSIRVEAGDGAKFPQPGPGEHFSVTIEDRRTGQIEIMNCTGRSGDILNVLRGQEGMVPQAFLLGATVSNRLTAGALTTLANAAGVVEAPVDGNQYGRQNETWTQVTWTSVANKPATFPPTLPIPSSGITGLDAKQAAQDAAITASQTAITDIQTTLPLKENKAEKGAASGYAPLDATTKVPAAFLPAYVDDVLEFANLAAFPTPGTSGVIYVALDTNKTYRWGGSTYTEISPSPGSTDAVPEGSTNLYFTPARAAAAAPVQSVAGRQGNVVLTKADVGLDNVDNTSDVNKPVSNATQLALNLKADIASPTFTGNPKAPTPTAGDNDTSIATTAFVQNALASSAAATSIGDIPPVTPTAGQLWYESDTGNTYIWYTDADSSQWVQQSSFVAGTANSDAGIVQMFARSAPPAGWLKANGALVSRTVYATLYAAIGTMFGVGDGSTTFQLPDLRGEFIRFWDDSRGIDPGRAFGSAQAGDMASHTHPFVGSSATSSGNSVDHTHSFSDSSSTTGGQSASHTHTQTTGNGSGGLTGYFLSATYSTTGPFQNTGTTSAGHTHTVAVSGTSGANSVDHTHTVTAAGANTAFGGAETRPRNVALLACIKY